MVQMYEVFMNGYTIILTNKIEKETDFKLFLLNTYTIEEVLKQFRKGTIREAHIYYPDVEVLLKKFKRTIPTIKAAGGLVMNAEKEVLFIYRNDKWDLPKGKLNKNETTENAAVREVVEETGIQELKMERFLKKTYHIFKHKNSGKYQLKETYWYLMYSDYKGLLIPQQEEGIADVVWKNQLQIRAALENSYQNIKQLLPEYH